MMFLWFWVFFATLKVVRNQIWKVCDQKPLHNCSALTPGHIFGYFKGRVLAWANSTINTRPWVFPFGSTNVIQSFPSRVIVRRLSFGVLYNSY